MEILQTVKMLAQDNDDMHINFHINSMPWRHKHVHDYWEIQIMFVGKVDNYINQHSNVLTADMVQILRPDDVHYLEYASKQRYECLNLEIKKDFFQKTCNIFYPDLFDYLLQYNDKIPAFQLDEIALYKIKEKVALAQQKINIIDETRQFYLTEILTECLIAFIYQHFIYRKKQAYSFSDTFIRTLQKPENIGLRLHEVCEKFPCNVEYVIRQFKQDGKETPNKVFREIKLKYACGLLRTTEYSLEVIANAIGFNSVEHFNRIFKEKFEMMPSAYRQKYYRK